MFFQRYYNYLDKIPSFRSIKSEYINKVKRSYLANLNKAELMSLLDKMNEEELKELLYGLDNEQFIRYTTKEFKETDINHK